jgi:single-stranded DNA-binding protein
VVAFGDAAGELLRLDKGDAVSVSGPFTVETFAKDGETRLRRKIVADRIAAPRLSERKPVEPRETLRPDDELSDLPF